MSSVLGTNPSLLHSPDSALNVGGSGSLAVFSLINICQALHQLRAQCFLAHTRHRSGFLNLLVVGGGEDGDGGGDDDDEDDDDDVGEGKKSV